MAKELGLDRDTYEAMLDSVAGVRSAADLDARGRRRVIGHLRANLSDHLVQHGIAPNTLGARPLLQKIEALLADAGRPWQYADALAQRIAKRDRLEFCGDTELRKIVAALSYDQARRRGARRQRVHDA